MNPEVDRYFINGCGRCALGGTPQCKVHNWEKELASLRHILLDSGLIEELKWSVPCYTFHKKNVLILAAFKDYCAISFFKGALLQDARGLLQAPGENTQSARLLKFTNIKQVYALEKEIKSYIQEAITLEQTSLKVKLKSTESFVLPEEFKKRLGQDSELRLAFEKLTPGRQRAYVIYFSAAKQAKTRMARIEKCLKLILRGKGLND